MHKSNRPESAAVVVVVSWSEGPLACQALFHLHLAINIIQRLEELELKLRASFPTSFLGTEMGSNFRCCTVCQASASGAQAKASLLLPVAETESTSKVQSTQIWTLITFKLSGCVLTVVRQRLSVEFFIYLAINVEDNLYYLLLYFIYTVGKRTLKCVLINVNVYTGSHM